MNKQLYQIRVEGHLDHCWAEWFDGMTMTYPTHTVSETVLVGYVVDQAALHGLLNKVRDLNLPLVAVVRLPAPGYDGNV